MARLEAQSPVFIPRMTLIGRGSTTARLAGTVAYPMHSIDNLEQGARLALTLSSDFEFFQGEKPGVAERRQEKNCYGLLKRT